MTYVLLIYRSSPPEPVDAAADRAAMVRHRALQEQTRSRDELLSVAQLGDARNSRTVRARGGAHQVTDGPYVETKEWLVGFYLLECEDEQEALARARTLADDRHAIEVRPVAWRWAR